MSISYKVTRVFNVASDSSETPVALPSGEPIVAFANIELGKGKEKIELNFLAVVLKDKKGLCAEFIGMSKDRPYVTFADNKLSKAILNDVMIAYHQGLVCTETESLAPEDLDDKTADLR